MAVIFCPRLLAAFTLGAVEFDPLTCIFICTVDKINGAGFIRRHLLAFQGSSSCRPLMCLSSSHFLGVGYASYLPNLSLHVIKVTHLAPSFSMC